ncbi:MAG: hypothetical protein DWQ02_02590 [Bacteroidetes bacterium]|nr:MAG: hypothetical protein DWQ02_02590 [Bacteroidota bacterium]
MGANKKIKKSEPLIFIRDCLPQLMAGEYTVTSSMTVSGADKPIRPSEKSFHVDGPRFSLLPSDIYNIYPPKGLTGPLDTTLPHIVFKRRTLPWERTIDGGDHHSGSVKNAPWMALLLLNEDEIAENDVKVKSRLIAEILKPGENEEGKSITGPEIGITTGTPKLAPWEKEGGEAAEIKCNSIDIQSSLFKTIAPTPEDLPYLAHVRKVEVDKNKEQADNDDDGYFSVIIGNRLPSRNEDKNVLNTVFLVSLEGFHRYLKNPNDLKTDLVRLVVLHSWNFNVAKGKNFRELCENLKSRTSPLKMSYDEKEVSPELKRIYDYGYTALPHQLRTGGKTLSWYRGPLNPNFLPTEPKTRTFASADNALRFDRENGMVDVSYAAAWQLGRLLALEDQEFYSKIQQWKTANKQQVRKYRLQEEIASSLPGFEINENEADNSKETNEQRNKIVLEDLVGDFLKEKYSPTSEGKITPRKIDVQKKFEPVNWENEAKKIKTVPIPPMVSKWLGRLFLLHGVPFNYLVAHEKMLQEETLGTFYIDSSWVEALLDGALSIARSTDAEILLNKVKDGQFLPEEIKKYKEEFEDLKKKFGEMKGGGEIPARITGHVTGFLLRSELISGWKGIKVLAKEKGGEWLQPLRIERVEDDVLLCFFNGKVTQVVIVQPPENLHFGLEKVPLEKGEWKWMKKMRNEDGSITEKTSKEIPLKDVDKGVIKIAEAAAKLGLGTSADFAFQMIESPIIYTLNIKDNQ